MQGNLAASLRHALGRVYKRLPPKRRTLLRGRGVWKLALRKLMAPAFQYPVTFVTPQGVHLRITTDPVDELVVYDMLSAISHQYFPPRSFGLVNHPIILDVGSHHGYYAMLALGQYENSFVICVEPSIEAIGHIKANIKLNNWEHRARIVHAALAERSGLGNLLAGAYSYSHSLHSTGMTSSGLVEQVPLLTLEEVLQEMHPHIIKCNAEGGEYALVNQLSYLDARPVLVILMVHVEKNLGSAKQLVAEMEKLGYTAEWVKEHETRPVIHFWHNEVK